MNDTKPPATLRVTDLVLRKSAQRILGQNLVTPETLYVQRILGASATQEQIDEQIAAVRRLPWSSIVLPE